MKRLLIVFALTASVFLSSQAMAGDNATTEEYVQKVHEAAAMINARGLEESIKLLGDPKGPFVWKDSYVFLMDMKGKMLAHPMQPELIRYEHVLLETDSTGKAIFVHFVNVAREHGEGWVDYMCPKPGKKSPSKKVPISTKCPPRNSLWVLESMWGHDVLMLCKAKSIRINLGRKAKMKTDILVF